MPILLPDSTETKSIFTSKSAWWNVIVTVVGTLQSTGVIAGIPPPYGIIIAGVVGIILRFATSQPVTLTGNPPAASLILKD